MDQSVEGHLHRGRGAGGQGEKEFIGVSLLQLWEINNSHYVRVSRGQQVLLCQAEVTTVATLLLVQHITKTTYRITSSVGKIAYAIYSSNSQKGILHQMQFYVFKNNNVEVLIEG